MNRKEFHIEKNNDNLEILSSYKDKVIMTWNYCSTLVRKANLTLVEELFCAQVLLLLK